jgi:glyoxylase-like metal-dependent hydrolase (beta-lactamase superfamily II)
VTVKIATRWFELKPIDERLTLVYEPYVDPLIRCNIWHLRGRDRDLLVDTGSGIASLRAEAQALFGKSLAVVLTHTHFDHIGGAYEFDSRIVHRDEARYLEHPPPGPSLRVADFPRDLLEMLTSTGYVIEGDELISAYPFAGYDSSKYSVRGVVPTRLVTHGDVIDLGDRTFEVMHLPGHSPGSIGLWERTTRILFSGDAIYDGVLLDEIPGANIADYVRTMEALRELPVEAVHGGHEPSFGRARMFEIIDSYLRKRGGAPPRA